VKNAVVFAISFHFASQQPIFFSSSNNIFTLFKAYTYYSLLFISIVVCGTNWCSDMLFISTLFELGQTGHLPQSVNLLIFPRKGLSSNLDGGTDYHEISFPGRDSVRISTEEPIIMKWVYICVYVFVYIYIHTHIYKSPWPESASELFRPGDRRLSAKLVPTFADRGCHVVSVTDPYGRILNFLDRMSIYIYIYIYICVCVRMYVYKEYP
jgi:hypothetical protein